MAASAMPLLSNGHAYPNLADFFGAWLHQDFDIVGETLEDICAAFLAETTLVQATALAAEITEILTSQEGPLDDFIECEFQPDIVVREFEPDGRAFLNKLRDLLAADRSMWVNPGVPPTA